MKDITIPYERFEELLKAEIRLEMLLEDETSLGQVETDDEFTEIDKTNVYDEVREVITKIISSTNRVGKIFYSNNDEVLGIVDGMYLYIKGKSFHDMTDGKYKGKGFDILIKYNIVSKSRLSKRDNSIAKKIPGAKGTITSTPINLSFIKEVGLYEEIFKHDRVDRDQYQLLN